jgi:predicted ATPase
MTSEHPTKEDGLVVQETLIKSYNTIIERGKPGHLGSLQTVAIWNKAQLSLLVARPNKVVLDSDFGCGKTLLMKSFAIQVANRLDLLISSSEVDVIFVSVSAARTQVEVDFWMFC